MSHLLVFPFPAQGHLLPLLHFSTHLATRFSFTITIIITPQNLPLLQPFLSSTSHIHPLILPLPPSPSLPQTTPSAALIRALSSLTPSEELVPPKEFGGEGKVVKGWVAQREVLGHAAVGAFMTHCGWNSVVEGIVAGVLLLAWPMEADQFVNARLLVEEKGVAVRVCDGEVPEAEELGKMIREAVEEGSWPEVKKKVAEMRRKAKEAVGEGGSSELDLEELVKLLNYN